MLLGTISHEKTLMEDTVATLRFCTNVRQVTTQPRISEHTSHQALVKSLEQEVKVKILILNLNLILHW